MNIFDNHSFRVILDYAHNPAAVRAMCDLTDRMTVQGRRIVVLSAPGDRRDQDIADVAGAAAGHFDHYICRRDDSPRGRGEDEVPRMLERGLVDAGVASGQVEVIVDEQASIAAALSMARRGDLVLVLGDAITRCWKQIIYFDSDDAGALEGDAAKRRDDPIGVEGFELPDGLTLVRDDRGVRIAREEDD